MEILLSEEFLTDLSRLRSNLERKCRSMLSSLRKMEASTLRAQIMPGWRLHKLKSSPFSTLKVDRNYRILCNIEGQKCYIVRVVKHDLADSAYINRNDGINTPYGLEDFEIQPGNVFDILIAVGLPENDVLPFKEVTNEDDFMEALEKVDEPLQTYALSIYETTGRVIPHAKYTVFDIDKSFEEALQMSLSQWEVYLHPSQRYIVELPVNYRISVCGSAGTGKTVCAWYRIQHLAQQGHSIGFICSNKKILAVSKDVLDSLLQSISTDCYFMVPNSSDDIIQLADEVDHIVIDEGQELSPTWFPDLGYAISDKDTGLTLFYDLNQIGGNISAGDTKRFNHRLDTWRSSLNSISELSHYNLYINYRNSREIAEYCRETLAQSLPNNLQSQVPLFEAGKVVEEKINDRKELCVQIARIIHTLQKDFNDNEIGLIFNSYQGRDIRNLLTELRSFGIRTTNDIQDKKRILSVSARDIKGHERKAIIFCTPPMDYSAIKWGKAIDVYVALTRARDRLVVLQSP